MAAMIEIKDLTKQYRGRSSVKAVDQLNLTVEEGDIFGFVGPNGAGKTSTIRIMATLLKPTQGDIQVAGHWISKEPDQVRAVIGYMPDFFGVYNDMLVWEYLDFFGACYGISPDQRSALINDLLELVDLTHRRDDPVEGLSRGMKQRLGLARTLIHDPQVLILDEPASGLDPRARVEIRHLLVELARMGKTIFFSTHILADVAEICTRVGIIEAGKLVAAGRLEDLQQVLMPHRLVELTLLGHIEEAINWLHTFPGVLEVEEPFIENGNQEANERANGETSKLTTSRQRLVVKFSGDDQALSAMLSGLVSQGIPLVHFGEDSRNMEAVFMRATRGLVT